MDSITLYLEKFKTFTPPERAIRQAVAAAIAVVCGETIPEAAISVRGATVFVAVHPVLKAELFMRTEEVLREIAARLSQGRVQEVR